MRRRIHWKFVHPPRGGLDLKHLWNCVDRSMRVAQVAVNGGVTIARLRESPWLMSAMRQEPEVVVSRSCDNCLDRVICICIYFELQLTFFPNFRQLYYVLRIVYVDDGTKRRIQVLRFCKEVRDSRFAAAYRSRGKGNLSQSLFAVALFWVAVDRSTTVERMHQRKKEAA